MKLGFLLTILIILLGLCVALGYATAHEAPSGWNYAAGCCSNKDCAPAPASDFTARKDGWYIQSRDEVVPYDSTKLKKSGDQDFHICAAIESGTLLCLYVPNMPT